MIQCLFLFLDKSREVTHVDCRPFEGSVRSSALHSAAGLLIHNKSPKYLQIEVENIILLHTALLSNSDVYNLTLTYLTTLIEMSRVD